MTQNPVRESLPVPRQSATDEVEVDPPEPDHDTLMFVDIVNPGWAAVAALLIGWVRPAPWLLALLLVAVLSVLWLFAVLRFLSVDAWGDAAASLEATSPSTLQGDGLVPSNAAKNR